MSKPVMFGLIPAMTIVAFVLSILAYTREHKHEFIVKDENGEQVKMRDWHNSDEGKGFMKPYIQSQIFSASDISAGENPIPMVVKQNYAYMYPDNDPNNGITFFSQQDVSSAPGTLNFLPK